MKSSGRSLTKFLLRKYLYPNGINKTGVNSSGILNSSLNIFSSKDSTQILFCSLQVTNLHISLVRQSNSRVAQPSVRDLESHQMLALYKVHLLYKAFMALTCCSGNTTKKQKDTRKSRVFFILFFSICKHHKSLVLKNNYIPSLLLHTL